MAWCPPPALARSKRPSPTDHQLVHCDCLAWWESCGTPPGCLRMESPEEPGAGSGTHGVAVPAPAKPPCQQPGMEGTAQHGRVSVSTAAPAICARGSAAAARAQRSLLCTFSCLWGTAQAPCPCRLPRLLQADTLTACESLQLTRKRGLITALDSPACFPNANAPFAVRVFIFQQKQNPAPDKRSSAPATVLQQELPSCSLTSYQRFVIFEEITNLKVFGFGAAIAA